MREGVGAGLGEKADKQIWTPTQMRARQAGRQSTARRCEGLYLTRQLGPLGSEFEMLPDHMYSFVEQQR